MKTGIELITEERKRQVSKEGYDAGHDDEHDNREIAQAASAYVQQYVERAWLVNNELGVPSPKKYRKGPPHEDWPWGNEWWKPDTPLRTLVKAGALIAAEIDRLQRAARAQGGRRESA